MGILKVGILNGEILEGEELFVPPLYVSHTNTQYTDCIIYALFMCYLF